MAARLWNRLTTMRVGAAALGFLLNYGCGGGDSTTNPPPPPPPPPGGSFALTFSGSPLTIARNASGTLSIGIVRTGGFTGAISLTTVGLPTGVTVGFAPQHVTLEAASAVTINVGGAAATGTFTFTVRGNAVGQTQQTVDVGLTVTAPTQAGPFSLSISATSHLAHPNNILSVHPVITVTRNPTFTGPISFSTSGLPATLFVGFTPNNTTAGSVNAVVVNAGATPNGTYSATIRGSSSQGDQTISFQIVVAPVTTGSIKWKYCSASLPRVLFAYKDGNGPWTRVMPSGADTSYSFNLTSGSGQVAEVHAEGSGYRTTIWSFTSQEMATRAAAQCTLIRNATTRTANGSFGGVTGFRMSLVGMGWWFGSANGNGSFTLLNLPPGPLDVVAVRNGETADPTAIPVDRMIIRRGVNPASGSTLPVVDFGAAESFAPTSATWTFVSGGLGVPPFGISQMFTTSTGSTGLFTAIPGVDGQAQQRTVYGVPLNQTVAGDLHQVVATIVTNGPVPGSPARATRQIVAYARTLSNQTLNFGPDMPAPTVLSIGALPAGRLRAQGTLPQQYNTGVTWDISQAATDNHMTIHATRGFLGPGSLYDLSMPDLTGLTGWDTQFVIRPNLQVQWWASGGGPTLDFFDGRYLFNSIRSRWAGIMTGITAPADGAIYLFGRALGVATP